MLKKLFPRTEDSRLKKITKVFSLLLFAAIFLYAAFFVVQKVRAFPNSILSFSPATKTVGGNQSFTLDAMLDPRTNQVNAVSLRVTFDAAKFQLDSISTTGSPYTVTLLAASINNTAGTGAIDVGVAPGTAPVTTFSKVATFTFHSLASAVSASSIAFTTSSMAAAAGEGSMDVITQRNPAAVTVDTAAPTGTSLTYTNGYFTAASVALTASDGTDAVSGINTASRVVKRRSATLTGTTCGTYGAWGNITPTGTYPNLTDPTVANGNCYQYQYLVSDNAGNQATFTGTNTAKIDTVAPTMAQVTAVPALTNDDTPNYTFSSTEAGNITYTGDCSSSTTAAVSGNNAITFNTLSSAVHSNCTIKVADAAGNLSAVLAVNSFTVDAVAPAISAVAPASNASINSITSANGGSDVSYALSETVQSGSIVFTRTGGTADAASPHTCALKGTALNSGAHNNINLADTTNACASAQTLVNGATYTMALSATDPAGNAATAVSKTGVIFDTAVPVLAQVTAVPSSTNDDTPNYTFSSTDAGTIAYAGDCSSATTAAVSGNNTVTFNALSVAAHSNCTITVTDAAGNASSALAVNSFTIDKTAPTITNITSSKADGTYSAGSVIDIAVTFSDAVTSTGSVTVTLDTGRNCAFTISNSTTGSCNYTVQNGDSSADLTTTAISGTVADQAGNALANFVPAINLGTNKNLVISAVAPALSQVTAVANVAIDTTPDFTFSSSKAGTITYAGDCTSAATTATAGNNTVTFNAISVGVHSNCTITVTDSSGSASAPLSVNLFAVTYPGDFNLDRKVDLFDYNIVLASYGSSTCGNNGDSNGDCRVNLFDYSAMLQDYGKSF